MSEVLHMRRIPRGRVNLVRTHKPQPIHAEPPAGEGGFAPLPPVEAGPGSPAPQTAPLVCEPGSPEALAEAYARGVSEGQRIAESEFREALEQMRKEEDQRIAGLMAGMSNRIRGLQRTLEDDAYRFALAVAERIIKREVMLTDDTVVGQIKEAIQRVVGVEAIKLRVHPSDEAVVRSHRAAFLSSLEHVHDLVVEGDDSIERGGCIIESASGNVDARVSTQLRQIETALFGTRQPAGGLPQ